MKKLTILITVLLISFQTFAQKSQEAKTLLDNVAKKVEGYKNIYIEFNHKLDNEEANVH